MRAIIDPSNPFISEELEKDFYIQLGLNVLEFIKEQFKLNPNALEFSRDNSITMTPGNKRLLFVTNRSKIKKAESGVIVSNNGYTVTLIKKKFPVDTNLELEELGKETAPMFEDISTLYNSDFAIFPSESEIDIIIIETLNDLGLEI